MRSILMAVFLTGSMLGLPGNADAAPPKGKKPDIVISGCTRFVPPWCELISQGGKTYALVDDFPPVPVGIDATVWGVKTGEIGSCFAPIVYVLRWKPNERACPQ